MPEPEHRDRLARGRPARRLLEEAGETLLPQSAAFAEETGSPEAAAEGFSLNIVNVA